MMRKIKTKTTPSDEAEFSDVEIAARRDEVVRRMLAKPYEPQKKTQEKKRRASLDAS